MWHHGEETVTDLQPRRPDEERESDYSGECVSLSGWLVTVIPPPGCCLYLRLIFSYGQKLKGKCFHTTPQQYEQMCGVCSLEAGCLSWLSTLKRTMSSGSFVLACLSTQHSAKYNHSENIWDIKDLKKKDAVIYKLSWPHSLVYNLSQCGELSNVDCV